MELFHGEERASACIVCRLPGAVEDLHPFVLLRICGRDVLGYQYHKERYRYEN